MYTFNEINDATGFAVGDKFSDADDVRAYFREERIASMWEGREEAAEMSLVNTQAVLDRMAETVIEHGWHMENDAEADEMYSP